MTQVVVEKTDLSRSVDPLMSLLWNDYSVFFIKKILVKMNDRLIKKHKNINFKTNNIMKGNSNLLVIVKYYYTFKKYNRNSIKSHCPFRNNIAFQ